MQAFLHVTVRSDIHTSAQEEDTSSRATRLKTNMAAAHLWQAERKMRLCFCTCEILIWHDRQMPCLKAESLTGSYLRAWRQIDQLSAPHGDFLYCPHPRISQQLLYQNVQTATFITVHGNFWVLQHVWNSTSVSREGVCSWLCEDELLPVLCFHLVYSAKEKVSQEWRPVLTDEGHSLCCCQTPLL